MTRDELAALSDRIKALAAERDQLVVRRESLVAERQQLVAWHMALRDEIGHNLLHKRAIERERVSAQRDFGLLRASLPRTVGSGVLDGGFGERSYRGASWKLTASERARSAA